MSNRPKCDENESSFSDDPCPYAAKYRATMMFHPATPGAEVRVLNLCAWHLRVALRYVDKYERDTTLVYEPLP